MITIYHNSRCGKSRAALAILQESGKEFKNINYLQDVPTAAELTVILKKLGIKAHDLIRKTEAVYIDNYKGKELTEPEWIQVMVAHPIFIERPIIVSGAHAIIGRPTERVYEVLSK